MIKERRKIEIEKEIYIAPDGKEFESEDECEEYEPRLSTKSTIMYDHKFNKTNDLDACHYVRLPSPAAVNAFLKLCAYDGIYTRGIDQPGLYMYVEGTYGAGEAWSNLSEILSKMEVLLANES